jgi:hypothetical protein
MEANTNTDKRAIPTAEQETQRPGPAHMLLDVFIGRWKTEGHTIATPSSPAISITGTDTYEWLEGGFFMIHHVDVMMGVQKVKAIEIVSHDHASNKYFPNSFDNQGNMGNYQMELQEVYGQSRERLSGLQFGSTTIGTR